MDDFAASVGNELRPSAFLEDIEGGVANTGTGLVLSLAPELDCFVVAYIDGVMGVESGSQRTCAGRLDNLRG